MGPGKVRLPSSGVFVSLLLPCLGTYRLCLLWGSKMCSPMYARALNLTQGEGLTGSTHPNKLHSPAPLVCWEQRARGLLLPLASFGLFSLMYSNVTCAQAYPVHYERKNISPEINWQLIVHICALCLLCTRDIIP